MEDVSDKQKPEFETLDKLSQCETVWDARGSQWQAGTYLILAYCKVSCLLHVLGHTSFD